MDLLIWGAGGHAAVVADIARLTGWTVVGFVEDCHPARAGRTWCNAPVVGVGAAEALVRAGVRQAAVAIGNPRVRLAKAEALAAWGCRLVPLIHPRAVVAESAVLGEGVVVCAGAVVQPLARIGPLGVVNTLASADHDCDLSPAVHLCPGARLGGHVRAGIGAWVGIGACVRDRVHLGEWCLIGAGAAVVADIPAHVVAFGVPASPHGRSPFSPNVGTDRTPGSSFPPPPPD